MDLRFVGGTEIMFSNDIENSYLREMKKLEKPKKKDKKVKEGKRSTRVEEVGWGSEPVGPEVLAARWKAMAAQAGWTHAWAAVHGELWCSGRIETQDGLMERTGLSRGSVHGALHALMERGLVESVEPSGSAKRQYRATEDAWRVVEVLWLEPWQRSLAGWQEVARAVVVDAPAAPGQDGGAPWGEWGEWTSKLAAWVVALREGDAERWERGLRKF